jgi:hypothetical protein
MPQGKSSFTWDSPSLRFRESSTGRFVAHRKVFQEMQKVVQVSQQRMLKTTERFSRGEITLPDFKLLMMQEVKSLNIAAAISANGGLAQMDAKRWGETGARLRREYGYLNELGTKIANGHINAQSGRLRTSARAYAASSQTLFWELTNRRMKETGNFVLARRVMGAVGTEHCSGCSMEASKDFMPLVDIAAIGSKECKWFCHCSIEYRIARLVKTEQAAQQIAELHNDPQSGGGSTYSLYVGSLKDQKLYSVVPYARLTRKVKGRQVSSRVMEKFIRRNINFLRAGNHAVGTWYDSEEDKTWLDVVVTFPN